MTYDSEAQWTWFFALPNLSATNPPVTNSSVQPSIASKRTNYPKFTIYFNFHIYCNIECMPLIFTGHTSDCVDKLSSQTVKKNVLDINTVKRYITSLPNDENIRKMIDGEPIFTTIPSVIGSFDCSTFRVKHAHCSTTYNWHQFNSIWMNTKNGNCPAWWSTGEWMKFHCLRRSVCLWTGYRKWFLYWKPSLIICPG